MLEDDRQDVDESHEKPDREDQGVEQLPPRPLPTFGFRQWVKPELLQS